MANKLSHSVRNIPTRWILPLLVLTLPVSIVLAVIWAQSAICPTELVFSDDFTGSQLDSTKWRTQYPSGKTELQYYADDAFELQDGVLKIRAEPRSMNGYSYTSGMITSLGTFSATYGYFEIRAKVPKGQGLWPAFWLMPADRTVWPPEIDVFEILGHQTNKVYMSNHWKNAAGQQEHITNNYVGPDFSEAFHTFAVEWEPSEIIWYIDGVERSRVDQNISSQPMFVLANLAVGGDWPGAPDASTPFPSYLEIDEIRVYNQSCRTYLPGVFQSYPYP